ncbi:MAG: flagellar biosynthesis protein FlhA [Brevinematales bacterium]|nr:flagellar biosynthesis protein FlhA [Brevinematales bacterium]
MNLPTSKFPTDIAVAVASVFAVVMMVIPLPSFLLDALIALNITITLGIFLTTFYVRKPADFFVFPSILLIVTIFRIGLNISTTRAILSKGAGLDVEIIKAFGNFVVGNNVVIGLVIFIILVIVQLIVITRGATRVSEVAARFTLDALPGKQLSINEDLNAGLITEEEAKKRRQELRMEADFYGSMDGASRFVQGDAIVSIIIVFVNIIGGLVVGLAFRGEDINTAIRNYILFAVGDGISTQIPALLMSTATGIIVTRSAAGEDFGKDVVKQLTVQPRILYITGGFLVVLGLLPGFPTIQLFAIGGSLIWLGILMERKMKEKEEKEKIEKEKEKKEKQIETIEEVLSVEPMEIEIGYNLIPLVDKEQGGDLVDRIKLIRKRIGQELGVLIPPIRIKDNVSLDPNEYLVKIKGTEIKRYKVYPDKLLVINPPKDFNIPGVDVKEPAFGLPARWISPENKKQAESLGLDVFDSISVVSTHLTEIVKENASEFIGRQEVKSILDTLKNTYPAVIDSLEPSKNLSIIQKVLQNLLREGVSIRNIIPILESLADSLEYTKNPEVITENVRQSISRQFLPKYADNTNTISVIILDPELEDTLASYTRETDTGFIYSVPPNLLRDFLNVLSEKIKNMIDKGLTPVVLCSTRIRRLIKEITVRTYRNLVVLSYNEIVPPYSVEQFDYISLNLTPAGAET